MEILLKTQNITTLDVFLEKLNVFKCSSHFFSSYFVAKTRRKLVFIYLANDVVQNGKKKGGEFTKEFSTVIHNAFIHVME